MLKRVVLVIAAVVLAGCGAKSSGGGGEIGWSDANAVVGENFNPKAAKSLNEVEVKEYVAEIYRPAAVDFYRYGDLNKTNLHHAKFQNLVISGLELSESFSGCAKKTKPDIDVIKASGDTAVQNIHLDWSDCMRSSLENAGATVSFAKCDISSVTTLQCPGKDYSAADGKSILDANDILGFGMADCNPDEGQRGSASEKVRSQCAVSGVFNGKSFQASFNQSFGNLSSQGGPCVFTRRNGSNTFLDCFDSGAKRKVKNGELGQEDVELIYRFNLANAYTSYLNVVSRTPLPFEVNDWSGIFTTSYQSPAYSLSRGGSTVTGTVR